MREIFEETGLTIKYPQLCGVKQWYLDSGERYVVFCYKTDCFSGSLSEHCFRVENGQWIDVLK